MQETKHYMLTFKRTDSLEVIGYSYADFVGCTDSKVHIRLCLHACEWSHIMKKLQTNYHSIFYNVC
jgi:hypothetical protein